MIAIQYKRLLLVLAAVACVAAACGSAEVGADEPASSTSAAPLTNDATSDSETPSDTGDESSAEADEPAPEPSDTGSGGSGLLPVDMCEQGQFVAGAISLDDLVTYGLLSSAEANIDGGGFNAALYETFGHLCNIEEIGGEENFITIGMSDGSDVFDLAVDSGVAERIGNWDVIVGNNWLSPLTMRFTDGAGNQDSLFVTWVPGDGSIPDAETLERLMSPLAEAIASKTSVDVSR